MKPPVQPYRFKLYCPDGSVLEGGAESYELCLDHLRHVKSDDPRIVCWYLGKYERNAKPLEVK